MHLSETINSTFCAPWCGSRILYYCQLSDHYNLSLLAVLCELSKLGHGDTVFSPMLVITLEHSVMSLSGGEVCTVTPILQMRKMRHQREG